MSADADLLDVVSQLGADERRVLAVLARRLLEGQQCYGRLDMARDSRDWRKERGEEFADALIYGAIAEVAATLSATASSPVSRSPRRGARGSNA